MKRIPDTPWIKEPIRDGGFPDDSGGDRTKACPVEFPEGKLFNRAALIEAEAVALNAIFDALMEPPYDPDEVPREFRVTRNSGLKGFSDSEI